MSSVKISKNLSYCERGNSSKRKNLFLPTKPTSQPTKTNQKTNIE